MSITVSVYAALLFLILTPGVLLRLPTAAMFSKLRIKGNKPLIGALVHAIVFGIVFYITKPFVWRMGVRLEGMSDLETEEDVEEEEEDKESMKSKESKESKESMKSKESKESKQ